ncbi:putative Chain A The Of Haloacid Dehalogenase-Like Hydrolase Domain Containing 2 protein [Naja naja]|nr:putative Chain A The Of Haloacid Dehalogenase-Like Hydrolase Domain Containing 2 protein [Naja naja]
MAARRVIKAVLVDLSGTLHIEDSAVPGAQEALKKQVISSKLRSAPVAVRFVTNTTKECKQDLLERLKQLDFDIKEDEIFTSLTAARNLLEQKKLVLDGAPLIAIHKARYYKKKDGLALGPGPFVTGLEYATDQKATVVGKPEQTFFLEALRGTNCGPEEAVMIGDLPFLSKRSGQFTVQTTV